MSFIFKLFIETLRFYKVKFDAALRFLFVLLLAGRYFSMANPLIDSNFSAFLSSFSQNPGRPDLCLSTLTSGNWLFLAFQLASFGLALLFALHYALAFSIEQRFSAPENDSAAMMIRHLQTAYADMLARREEAAQFQKAFIRKLQGEDDSGPSPRAQGGGEMTGLGEHNREMQNKKIRTNPRRLPEGMGPGRFALICLLRRLPGLLIFFGLSILVLFFSLPVMALPFILFAFFFCFTPLIYAAEHESLPASFRLSWRRGRGVKNFLGMQFFLSLMLLNLPDLLFNALFVSSNYSYWLCHSLLFTLKTFVIARLWGMSYLSFSLQGSKAADPASEL